jgi:hypothetical protein
VLVVSIPSKDMHRSMYKATQSALSQPRLALRRDVYNVGWFGIYRISRIQCEGPTGRLGTSVRAVSLLARFCRILSVRPFD